MPADQIGATGASIVGGAAAGSVELTTLIRELRITNAHATQYCDVVIAEGTWAANAAAVAVLGADNVVRIPANTSKVVWKNSKVKKAVNVNLICSGATTPIYVEGSLWLT